MESNGQNTPTPEAPDSSTTPVAPAHEPKTPPSAAPPPAPGSPNQPNIFERMLAGFQAWVNANPRRAVTTGVLILLLILSFFIRVPPPHVALSGEPLVPGGWLTNSTLTTLIIDVILLLIAFLATARMQLVPGGLQNIVEAILEYMYNLSESIAGRAASVYFPWATTLFLLILLSNYSGMIPGVGSIGFYHTEEAHASSAANQLAMADGKLILQESGGEGVATEGGEEHAKFVPLFRAPSADLNLTFGLAIATLIMVQYYGVRALGGRYFRKFWNTSGEGFWKGINIFTGILETVSEVSRILSLAFRLFGNIFAGEVVLATMAFLVTFLIPVPFYVLELLVGAVQALVFAMLALVFFSMATISHGHDEHGEHAI